MEEVGYVISSKDFLVYLDGLPTIKINDMVVSEGGTRGWVNALLDDRVEVLLLDEGVITPGQMFKKMGDKLGIKTGEFLLGRSVNPIGVPLDGKALVLKPKEGTQLELDTQASGIKSRRFISEQMVTGLTLIDSLIPLGKGQRELIMGDAHSGKTGFIIDLIVNQKNTGVICIYTSIGQPITHVRRMIDILKSNDALGHSIIIAASSAEPAPLIFLAPQAGFSVAEYFQRQGKDVLLILDDMGNHAKIYREISLLSNKSPGKESYPGDIFYQHSHLVERAGYFKDEFGGGSITALPVIELNMSDFTTLIPTNIMSMTDGHLLFKSALHSQGQDPAIDISLSVSRVGRQTQNRLINALSSKVRQLLAEAEQLETVSRFSSELPPETQLLLKQKIFITEIIRQEALSFLNINTQTILLGLVFTGFLKDKTDAYLKKIKKDLIQAFVTDPALSPFTEGVNELPDEKTLIAELEKLTPKLNQMFPKQ